MVCTRAQPAGYPSVIRYRLVTSLREQQAEVLAGHADLAQLGYDDQALAAQYPNRVHTALKLWTDYLFLNTRQPPFSSLAARQAVNYAVIEPGSCSCLISRPVKPP